MPGQLDQPVFQPATVFSYYTPDYEVPGTRLQGPAFQILSTSTTLRRANIANQLIYSGIAVATRTTRRGRSSALLSLDPLAAGDPVAACRPAQHAPPSRHDVAADARRDHDRGERASPTTERTRRKRAQTAVYLVVTSPQYDVQR